MSNVAYANFGAASAPMENKVAELEGGYSRLANDLLDATMCSGLPETELCILMAVWRKTYGYSKKMDWISNEQFEEMIKKHFTHCSAAKNNLIRRKVLLQEGRKVGMNTNISEWQTKNNGFCKTLAKPAKKTLSTSANRIKQKLLTTKDNITKDNKHNNPPIPPRGKSEKFDPLSIPIPEWLNPQSWAEWVTYRSQSKKPIKTALTVTKAFNLLKECFDEGYDPSEVINTSIANGYQGLFKPKGAPRGQRVVEATPHWNSREGWEDFI